MYIKGHCGPIRPQRSTWRTTWLANLRFQALLEKQPPPREFMGKMFQAAQLTHERFLTIDHSRKIFF
jgi:hypothetical protein